MQTFAGLMTPSALRYISLCLQGPAGDVQGADEETQAELEALRRERALLIDKLNNHPDVRKYAGKVSPLSGSSYSFA